jgi:hypothetical protein
MWRDEAWLLDMLQACRKALQHVEGLGEHRFHVSPLHQDAIIRQLTILGEAAKQVSPEFRDAHPEIPWKKIWIRFGGSFSKTFPALPPHLDNWCRQRTQAGEAGDAPCPYPDALLECLNGVAYRPSADSLEAVGG